MKWSHGWHIVLIIYILFVFSNSLTPADLSSEKSGFVLELAHRLLTFAGFSTVWLTEHVVRKCAHFGEYTVLGILLYQSMRRIYIGNTYRYAFHAAGIFFIPFVDETLQLFTEGRSGQISDVWLDMSGVIFGTVICTLIGTRLKKLRTEK